MPSVGKSQKNNVRLRLITRPTAVRPQEVKIAVEASIPNPIEELENLDRALAAEPRRVTERRGIEPAAA